MKKAALLTLFCLPFLPAYTQVVGGMDVKFEKLYMDEKYEDCAYRGEKMLESDSYKDNPEVMLYTSMCWFRISQINDEKKQAEYPKALSDAMKYAAKMRKKDKENLMFTDNKDYFEEMKKAVIEGSRPQIDDEKKRKIAVNNYKALNKAIPEDHAVLFMKGVLEILNRNESEGVRNVADAVKGLDADFSVAKPKVSKTSKLLVEESLCRYADILMGRDMGDSARKTIDRGLRYLPESERFKTKLTNLK